MFLAGAPKLGGAGGAIAPPEVSRFKYIAIRLAP